MKEYQVQIKETLIKTVVVEAESAQEAMELAEREWKDGVHVLDADHFRDVVFTIPSRSARER